ncbi:hypothetical protein D3C87_1521370 [compost metagenome]
MIERIVCARSLQDIHDGFLIRVTESCRLIDWQQAHRAHLIYKVMELIKIAIEGFCNFFVRRGTAEICFELHHCFIQQFCFVTNRSRHPVLRTQFIEDGSTNTEFSVSFKFIITSGVVLFDGIHQTDHSGRNQIIQLDIRGKTNSDFLSDKLNKWCVFSDDIVFVGRTLFSRLVLVLLKQRRIFPHYFSLTCLC